MAGHPTLIFRFLMFAVFHSLCATRLVKDGFGCMSQQTYRICYNLISTILLSWVMLADRNSAVIYIAPGAWSLFMYLLQLSLIVILAGCLGQTGIADFFGVARPAPRHLVTTGWYAYVRHPLYLFSIMFMALNPVMTSRWLTLTLLSTMYFILGGLIEERRLLAEFGDDYRRYQQNVPYIIPNLSLLCSTPPHRK